MSYIKPFIPLFSRPKVYVWLAKGHTANSVSVIRQVHGSGLKAVRHSGRFTDKEKERHGVEQTPLDESDAKTFLYSFEGNVNPRTTSDPTDKVIPMPFGEIRFDVQNEPSISPRQAKGLDTDRLASESGGKRFSDDIVNLARHSPTKEFKNNTKGASKFSEFANDSSVKTENLKVHPSTVNYSKYDSKNEKQSNETNAHLQSETLDVKVSEQSTDNYFDEHYFGGAMETDNSHLQFQSSNRLQNEPGSTEKSSIISDESSSDTLVHGNFFDEQYFCETSVENSTASSKQAIESSSDEAEFLKKIRQKYETLQGSDGDNKNFFDEQYFELTDKVPLASTDDLVENKTQIIISQSEPEGHVVTDRIDTEQKSKASLKKREAKELVLSDNDTQTTEGVDVPLISKEPVVMEADNKTERKAMDYVKELRAQQHKSTEAESSKAKMTEKQLEANPWAHSWDGKVDSRGFRVLTNQVPNFKYYIEEDIVHMLKSKVIYEDDDLVAIDKPYGLASHGGPGIHQSIGRVLKPLAQKVDKSLENLHLVHRLDKETTGVMLLAKNSKVANRLSEIFKKRQVIKKYWVITKGVPTPEEGVIDIPMAEGTVAGKIRMTLMPRYPTEMKVMRKRSMYRSKGQEAVTNFRVLSEYLSTALVECQPESGVKHQIRCHLAFGLNTPILGDHKYSHLSKLAPQKLHPDILQRLGMRQSKVRTLPMHLHAKTLILPEFRDGKNLFIQAPLPKHFKENMRWLKIKMPK